MQKRARVSLMREWWAHLSLHKLRWLNSSLSSTQRGFWICGSWASREMIVIVNAVLLPLPNTFIWLITSALHVEVKWSKHQLFNCIPIRSSSCPGPVMLRGPVSGWAHMGHLLLGEWEVIGFNQLIPRTWAHPVDSPACLSTVVASMRRCP